MPPRRATTPPDDDDFRALMAAMVQESLTAPTVTVSKRSHGTMGGDDSDSEEGAGAAFTVVSANQNIVAATKLYADKKRLRADQTTELEQFANDPSSLREIKLANIFAFGNELNKLIASQPSYKVSADLNTNVAKYAIAILLSSNITTYKGDAMTDALMVVVKKLRFDLPPGLENIPTDWAKVVGAGKYAPTQRRSKVKKVVRASLKPNEDGVYAPSVEHQNIYDLAQVVIKDTQCERNVYMKHPGNNFWDKLDDRLSQIRNAAKGDKKKIVRAFRQALTDDQNKHGAKTYVLDENVVDTFQQEVDDLLAIGFADAVTSAQAQGSNA